LELVAIVLRGVGTKVRDSLSRVPVVLLSSCGDLYHVPRTIRHALRKTRECQAYEAVKFVGALVKYPFPTSMTLGRRIDRLESPRLTQLKDEVLTHDIEDPILHI